MNILITEDLLSEKDTLWKHLLLIVLILLVCGSECWDSRLPWHGGCMGWVRTVPSSHSRQMHRGLTSLLPHQCPRQPEMDPFSILSLRVSDWLCPGLCSCDDSEPLGPEHILNSPVLHSQQPRLYVTAFLMSDQSRLPNHKQSQEKHAGKPPEAFWFSARVSEVPGRISFQVFISASAPR